MSEYLTFVFMVHFNVYDYCGKRIGVFVTLLLTILTMNEIRKPYIIVSRYLDNNCYRDT